MKIGTQTASLVNHLYSRMTEGAPVPVVGMGATMLGWSDRHAATVMKVFKVGKVDYMGLASDIATVTSGSCHDGSAKWDFAPRPDGEATYFFRQDNAGKWIPVRLNADTGRWVKAGSHGVILGKRDHYFDPSF